MRFAGPDGFGDLELIYGDDNPVQGIVIPPLFDEHNRMRRVIAQAMRTLAMNGIGTRMPVLAGLGESLSDLANARLKDWRAAIAAAAAPAFTIAFRGGALIDDAAGDIPHWRLSPVAGAALIRDLDRGRLVGGEADAADTPYLLRGGHRLGRELHAELIAAVPMASNKARTIRTADDPAPADAYIDFAPIWRRAEPGDDPDLTNWVVQDIIYWSKSCAIS